MAKLSAFDALLDEFQEAALGVIPWVTALHSAAGLLGGISSAGLHKDLRRGGGWGIPIGGDERVFADYFRHYAGIHPLAARSFSASAGSILTDRMIMSRTDFERTEFHCDWGRPNGFAQHLHLRLESDSNAIIGLSMTRTQAAPDFSAAELRLARRMLPHLRRAVAIYERFEEVRQAGSGMMAALDRMRRGVFGLGADGRVVFANAAARGLLAREDGLCLEDGVVAGVRADESRGLQRMLGRVVRGGASVPLTFERADGRASLRLEFVRLGGVAERIGMAPRAVVLLFVNDPEMEIEGLATLLRERYGLTVAEAAVAVHAARGKGVGAVAAALGIGEGTVRSHLKRAFEKTQTNRQAELAWLVSRLRD